VDSPLAGGVIIRCEAKEIISVVERGVDEGWAGVGGDPHFAAKYVQLYEPGCYCTGCVRSKVDTRVCHIVVI